VVAFTVWPIYPPEAKVPKYYRNLVRKLRGFSWVYEINVKFNLEQATKAQRGNRGIVLLLL